MNYKNVCGAAGIALASAVSFSVAAQAADLGKREVYHEEPAYVAPTTWSGGYIGGHLGASWTHGSADLTSTKYQYIIESSDEVVGHGSGRTDLGETSFLGGVHGGYNIQSGWLVYGVEGDVSFANNIDYLASIRGRFGVAANNWLFYGTAGVAFGGLNFSGEVSDTVYGHAYDFGDDQTGFVVGGGAEVKLSPNWSIGVEGLYYGFDGFSQAKYSEHEWQTEDACGWTAVSSKADAGADIGVVRARVSYHFNRGYEPLK